MSSPDKLLREIHHGFRIVLKWAARLLWLSPLLLPVRCMVGEIDQTTGDMAVIVFVAIVLAFFLILPLYIFWAVIVHFVSKKGAPSVELPFTSSGGDATKAFERVNQSIGGHQLIKLRGKAVPVDTVLPNSDHLMRDLWLTKGESPWRMSEVMDFAIVSDEQSPVVLQFESAPILIGDPETVTAGDGVQRMTPSLNLVFDLEPATAGDKAREKGQLLTLSNGDEVEILAFEHGVVDNVRHFRLGRRTCSLASENVGGAMPYRGAAGESGRLAVSTPVTPVWIRKISSNRDRSVQLKS